MLEQATFSVSCLDHCCTTGFKDFGTLSVRNVMHCHNQIQSKHRTSNFLELWCSDWWFSFCVCELTIPNRTRVKPTAGIDQTPNLCSFLLSLDPILVPEESQFRPCVAGRLAQALK